MNCIYLNSTKMDFQSTTTRQQRDTVDNFGPGGFFQISYLSIFSKSCCLLWSLRQSASSSMPEFNICKLCKSCDDFVSLTWNFNMLTTSCHHYSLIIFYWSLIKRLFSSCCLIYKWILFCILRQFVFWKFITCQKERISCVFA